MCLLGDNVQYRLLGDKGCNFIMNLSSGDPQPIISNVALGPSALGPSLSLPAQRRQLWISSLKVGCPAPTRLSADPRHLGQHLFHGRSLHSLLLHHLLHQVMSDASVDGPLLETDRLCLWNTPGTLRHRTLVAELPSILVHCLALKVQGRQWRWTGRDCRDRQSSGCAAASGQNQSLDFFLLSPRTKDNYAPEVKDKIEILG